MTEKPGAVAVREFTCPSCDSTLTVRCTTATGKPTSPHIQRWRLGEGWVARQGEVDRAAGDLALMTFERDLITGSLNTATATVTSLKADLTAARARIAELEAQQPTEPPEEPEPPTGKAPIPSGWALTKEFDFTIAGKSAWEHEDPKKPASNNNGIDRPQNAVWGQGPNKDELRLITNRDKAGGDVFTVDIKATRDTVTVPFGSLCEYTLDAPIPMGMWPAYPWYRPGTGGNGRGELDPSEIFMGHEPARRHMMTIHRTGTGQTGYQGANHGKYGEPLVMVPAGKRITHWFVMTADYAEQTISWDGKFQGVSRITKAEYEKKDPGGWATLSSAWYARLTNQAGGEGGAIPADFMFWGATIHRLAHAKPA